MLDSEKMQIRTLAIHFIANMLILKINKTKPKGHKLDEKPRARANVPR